MGKIMLLDCTLRDGGYVNDWEFGHDNLVNVFERVVGAGIDIIEVGFLDERRCFDSNRSIMPNTDCVSKIYGELDKKNTMVVGMIDYGTCGIENISECEGSYLDGIRVIFKKHLRREALEFCGELKKKGYKVFAQLVSITSYEDDEIMDLINLANDVEPYAVSMVDTYGLMHQENLMHYYELLNKYLNPSIGLGYHSHNNFQMAYANCIEMLMHKTDRMILVDGTIYGMGKSAGNAPIELLAMHLNSHYNKNYDISQILEAIDVNIVDLHEKYHWGYNMFFYIAASNDCHPNYVSYLMDKRTLSVKSINEILEKLQGEKKLLYDEKYIERLYVEYQTKEVNDDEDISKLKEVFMGRNVLLLGPGNNVDKQKEKIERYIKDNNPLVVTINFVHSDIKTDFIFLSNAKRYVQLATELSKKGRNYEIISTSNVTKTSGSFNYTLNYSSLLDRNAEIIDNSFIMLLKVMKKIGVDKVSLGGFDGYQGARHRDYFNSNMEYKFTSSEAKRLNEYIKCVLKEMSGYMEINFLTDSLYEYE